MKATGAEDLRQCKICGKFYMKEYVSDTGKCAMCIGKKVIAAGREYGWRGPLARKNKQSK